MIEIYNKYNINNNYLTCKVSLQEFRDQYHNILINGNDPHPTPLCHWDYAEQIITPKLGITLTQQRKSSIIKEQQDLL